jgi:hypothetical protein
MANSKGTNLSSPSRFYTNRVLKLTLTELSGRTFMTLAELQNKISKTVERQEHPDLKVLRSARAKSAATETRDSSDDHHGPSAGISKTLINFWLDAVLMLAFVVLSIVSVITQFVFPPGVNAKGWMLWGMNLNQWNGLQFATLAVLGFGIVVHVMLHWTWVCSVVAKKLIKGKKIPDGGLQTVYGVGLLIGLLLTAAVIVGIAMMTIKMPPH